MKLFCASLFVAILSVSAAGSGRHCMFRVHAEANPNDTPSFANSVRALFSGKQVAIEKMKKDWPLIGAKKSKSKIPGSEEAPDPKSQ